MKQKLIPILSITIGIIAFILTMNFTRRKEAEFRRLQEEFFQQQVQVRVLVAAHDIPSGTRLQQSDLIARNVFKVNVGDRAVEVKDGMRLLGRRVIFPIKKDSPVLWSDIEGGAATDSGLASIINNRMRAISLSVGGAAAVSGMVKPNDKVDIIGTFSFPSKTIAGEMETVTLTVLQDVSILATGTQIASDQLAQPARTASGYSTVTVEVTPREAELLVFAEQLQGRLTLSLRNRDDVYFERDLPTVNFEHLQENLMEYNLYRQQHIRHKTNVQ
ncbi:MAG: Flp pilus assembly protein CpaB [Kiritimatiellia bacterium]